jgi:hypothetical protein
VHAPSKLKKLTSACTVILTIIGTGLLWQLARWFRSHQIRQGCREGRTLQAAAMDY